MTALASGSPAPRSSSGGVGGSEANDLMTHLPILLKPDPTRVVIRPFMPADDEAEFANPQATRAQRIADRVLGLGEAEAAEELRGIMSGLSQHHRDVGRVLLRRYHDVNGLSIAAASISPDQTHLIGAYFSEEYAFEAAALFNPSIVPAPDQAGAPAGALRFVLSLRGVGEGQVSSITFRTGLLLADGSVTIDEPSAQAVSPRIEFVPGGATDDPGVRLFCDESRDLSETVIFPVTDHQRHGIEDLRLVRFVDDDGNVSYLGTYTAFSGDDIREELLLTTDFKTIDLSALRGAATRNKDMALFPRKIAGRYAMLGRQDHENIWLQTSTDLYKWEGGAKIVSPRWPWEFVQMGACGSPIEIDEGWLVITHGVGAVRNYCIGACLLDRDDPSKLLARVTLPLIRPSEAERYGYVPNVVYSCGALLHGRTLLLPYALADNVTSFATVPLDRLMATMK
jgi:predicted GH43/DUF377 family glycosyl hydrolase